MSRKFFCKVLKKLVSAKLFRYKLLEKSKPLFETAMGVVKGLMHGKTGNIKQLLDLDVRYGSQLAEAAFYKQKSKQH